MSSGLIEKQKEVWLISNQQFDQGHHNHGLDYHKKKSKKKSYCGCIIFLFFVMIFSAFIIGCMINIFLHIDTRQYLAI